MDFLRRNYSYYIYPRRKEKGGLQVECGKTRGVKTIINTSNILKRCFFSYFRNFFRTYLIFLPVVKVDYDIVQYLGNLFII